MSCCTWKCVPTVISSGVDISKFPGHHLFWQMSSQWGSQNYFKDWYLMKWQPTFLFLTILTQWIMVIISKGCKPDNFKSHNSLKLNFTKFEVFIQVLLNVNLSLNQTLLTFLLYMKQTWMTQLILTIFLWGVIFL